MKTLLLFTFTLCLSITLFGQYQIGHTTITFNDPLRTGGFGSGGGAGRQIQTEIYYPASLAGDDVALASGQFPIIVFGHGFVMAWDAYTNIWEHYVTMGYILAFPRTEGGFSPNHNEFGLDLVVVGERLQLLDSDNMSIFFESLNGNSAIMGHSMGGGASIIAAANNTSIKTVVGLAPAETNPSAIAAAANISVPALIFSGGQDGVTPAAEHHLPIYNALQSDCKSFVNIVGGAHCYFAGTNFNCDFGESTASSGISIDRATQQQLTYSVLDEWLDYYLKDNCTAYNSFLSSLEASPSELETQSTCSPVVVPTILENENELTSSVSGVSYQWYLDGSVIDGATNVTYTATVSGDYNVMVYYEFGCAESESVNVTISVDPPLSLSEESLNNFIVYPNPTSGVVYIKGNESQEEFSLYSVIGEKIMTAENTAEIDLSHLPEGVYYLKIGNSTKKIVKK